MCGTCVEHYALEILLKDVRGNLQMESLWGQPCHYFYLREASNFITAMDRTKRSFARKKQPFFEEVPHGVVLYRGLEMLLEQGFDSPEYQKLLKITLYRDAIAALCADGTRKAFDSSTEGLNIEPLGMLYDSETYFSGERSNLLRTHPQMFSLCKNLLEHYISWWLEGEEQNENDLQAMMEETGILDTLYKVTVEDRSRFYLLCRAIYFSILAFGCCSDGNKMLLAVAQGQLKGAPSMLGEDLWLQRVATLKLYDLEGFDTFLKYLTTIRPTNYCFLDIVRSFSVEQKKKLLNEALRHPVEETTDYYNSITRWLSEELEVLVRNNFQDS